METSIITMFNDLDVSNNDCVLKVRILRLWRLKDNNKLGEDWSIEMILQDEIGQRMQGYVRKTCIPKHDVWLAENRSLIVRKPSLGANLSTYRYVDNPHKLCFTSETRLSICDEFKGHIYGLSFATFDDIKTKNDRLIYLSFLIINYFPDVIGHVSKFFTNKNSFFRESQHQNRRTMEFADLSGNKIFLTLWDDYLKQLTKYVADNPNEEYLIIVLQFARVKYYGENIYVQNSYGNAVSRLMINDYLYEVLEISSQVDVEVPKLVGSSMLVTIKDEFLKKYSFYLISDLCTISEAIVGNKEWYYNGCKHCSRKVTSVFVDGVKVYECKNSSCNSVGVNAGPRFRIPIRVQDTTGVVSLTLFDRLDLMHTFPEELNIILEKKFAFIVEVSDYNIRNSYDVYGVSKLTDDEDPNDNQSLTVGSTSGMKSTEKELLMPSSNHLTPISNSKDVIPDRVSSLDGNDISLPMIDVKLKRKLDDTYDGQDDTGMSATKTKVDEQPTVDATVADGDIMSSRSKRRTDSQSSSSNKRNNTNVSSFRQPLRIISNASHPLTSSNVTQFYNGEENHAPTTNEGYISTSSSNTVSPTNTLKDCLMENQINQRLFINRRLNVISPQTTNPQQQFMSPGVNVTSTYHLTTLSNITNQHFTSSSNISRPGCSSSSTMLYGQSSSTHRASHRSFNVEHPIRMPNLDQFDTFNVENESINPYKSISSDYLDHGDQNVMCGVCNALLWDLETNKGKTNNSVTSYSLCYSTGDVQLPDIKPPPMSGKIANSINRGSAPYTFRLGGENYHSLGSLLPMPDTKPRFSQLYIYYTENEISNRRDIFRETDSTDKVLDNQIINFLKDMLDSHNPLVKSYRIARDCFQQNPKLDLKLRIIGTRKGDARTYNLPTTSKVAALVVGDIGDAVDKRYIIVTTQSGSLKQIPDKNEDPELYLLVRDHMMHGPCGVTHHKCYCMVDNACSKNFPKKLLNETSVDSNGFPVYRRRDLGNVVVKFGVNLENRHVVPYNKKLLKKYQAHINVEWCNQEGSIKYLFKYINKGPDHATISLVQNNGANQDENVDEVKVFYDCRYLSACEAAWRIFAFDVHYRFPSVTRLPFHLPGQQTVVFADDDDVEDVLNKPTIG
ncbi:uncharacterized protein LOC143593980 [Bidens hawaiensis]|uniref:uncharacterized protein LOC143593980 n=1 Tax=Bidens hawaiensis TaxID=980011 RepID=UPI00404B7AC8